MFSFFHTIFSKVTSAITSVVVAIGIISAPQTAPPAPTPHQEIVQTVQAPPTPTPTHIPTTKQIPTPVSQSINGQRANPNATKPIPSATPTASVKSDPRILGLWRLEGLYKLLNDGTWQKLVPPRYPMPIPYVEFTKTGMCSNYSNIPEGGIDGYICDKYDPYWLNGQDITPYTKYTAYIKPYVEYFAYWVPAHWNITALGQLELLSGDNRSKYIYKKLEFATVPAGNLVLSVDKKDIEKGTDIVIRGSTPSDDIVYLYIKRKDQENLGINAVWARSSLDICSLAKCVANPIIEEGMLIKPPAPASNLSPGLSFPYEGKCPWRGTQTYVEVLCIKPANGKFVVRIFNPGVGVLTSNSSPVYSSVITPTTAIPFVVHAKIANTAVEAKAEINLLSEKAVCSEPQPPGYSHKSVTCPPYWNQRKRGEVRFLPNDVVLELPPGKSVSSASSYVDLKLNGSDGPIKIRRDEAEFTATWASSGVAECKFDRSFGDQLYWDWQYIATAGTKQIYFRPSKNKVEPLDYTLSLKIECTKSGELTPSVKDGVDIKVQL